MSSTGALDPTFGNLGTALVGLQKNRVTDAVIDGAGHVLVSGNCLNGALCLARLFGRQDYFDLDNDNESRPQTDAILYLRYLLGLRDAALTGSALGAYADRTAGADIATYLSTPNITYPQCNASIVGAPGGPNAMLDGIVLVRTMMGVTGNAVTNGLNFPIGTVRTTWRTSSRI